MARKMRLEYPGAMYHVINRGNYRGAVFGTEGARKAFENCLFEACGKSGWVLHAYVVMNNHYHLALETPEGNLAVGMQWLQATFANRFNKLRGERGHLFQGRYKALLVEDGAVLGQVCDYIHLNPVRAGLVTVPELKDFRYSSYWYYRRPKERPPFLNLTTALFETGELADAKAGWQAYEAYLGWQAAEGPAGKTKAYASLSRGWALGSKGFKQALLKDHAAAMHARAWEAQGVKKVRMLQWETALAAALAQLSAEQQTQKAKNAAWKVAVAAQLKATTQVANAWLAEKLNMGSGHYLSKQVGLLRKDPNHPGRRLLKDPKKGKSTT